MKNPIFSILLLLASVSVFICTSCDDDDEATMSIVDSLQENLVFLANFNGNAIDSVSGTVAELKNNPTFTVDRHGEFGAVRFNGTNYVEFPHLEAVNFSATQDFTIVVYVLVDENQLEIEGQAVDIITKYCSDGLCERYPWAISSLQPPGNPNRTFSAGRYGNGPNGCEALPSIRLSEDFTGKWHCVAFQKKSTRLGLYVDGVLYQSTEDETDLLEDGCSTQNNSPLRFGVLDPERPIWTRGFFIGSIDECRIYSRALSEEEITYLASN